MNPETIVNLELHPIQDSSYIQKSKDQLGQQRCFCYGGFPELKNNHVLAK